MPTKNISQIKVPWLVKGVIKSRYYVYAVLSITSDTSQRWATISTTRAVEKSLALGFLNQNIFLRQYIGHLVWGEQSTDIRARGRHRPPASASGGASIHVNFGCPNDVFLPKVFQNRVRSRRAQTICLSISLSLFLDWYWNIMFYKGHLETEARDPSLESDSQFLTV